MNEKAWRHTITPSYADVARRYDDTVRDIVRERGDVFSAVYCPPDSDDFFSFSAWKSRAQQTRDIILDHKHRNADAYEKLQRIYAGDALKQQKQNLDDQLFQLTETARALIKADFNNVMTAKKNQRELAHDAPSDQQMRLLQVLSLRTSIAPDEIAAAAERCSDSIQALRVLHDLADKNDIYFPDLPSESDTTKAVDSLTELRDIVATDCAVDTNEMGYMQRVFWTTPSWGLNAPAVEMLDNPRFLRVDPSVFHKIDRSADSEAQQDNDKPKQDKALNFLTFNEKTGRLEKQDQPDPAED